MDTCNSHDVLHTYFNGGPVSIDIIEKHLYLGSLSAAKDLKTLSSYKISHILTIDTIPLPRHILEIKNLTVKFIQLSDQPREDILSYFDEAITFIDEGLSKGVVFVHCYFGVSRSASIIIAYIMKKYALSYYEAFEKIKLKRRIIHPNPGFISQLKLYRDMRYVIDKSNKKYKMFRLTVAADKVRKVKILPNDYFDVIKTDPAITQIQPEPNVYRCKKCRRLLASESNLLVHEDKSTKKQCIQICFVEPLSWMNNITQSMQGKLHCPKCTNKIGSFNWIMGCHCPCGSTVAPAFYLTPSKIDWTNVVKNVEVTI